MVELLVALAIVAVLAALAFPAYAYIRQKEAALQCGNTLRQWDQAFLLYATEHEGALPTATPVVSDWQDAIAPYLVHLAGYYISYPRYALRTQMHCPNNKVVGWAYGTNRNLLSAYTANPIRTMAGFVHPARTLLLTETDNDGVASTASNLTTGINYVRHQNQANIAFADGHLEFLTAPQAAASVLLIPN